MYCICDKREIEEMQPGEFMCLNCEKEIAPSNFMDRADIENDRIKDEQAEREIEKEVN